MNSDLLFLGIFLEDGKNIDRFFFNYIKKLDAHAIFTYHSTKFDGAKIYEISIVAYTL